MSGKSYRLFFFISILFISSSIYSQNQISIKPTLGGYIYNSENSLKIMGDKNYIINYGFEVSYENKSLLGYDFQIDYSFITSSRDNVIEWARISMYGDIVSKSYTNVTLTLHSFDLQLKNDLGEYFSLGYGLAFSFVYRTNEVQDYNFIDRLASFAIGINGAIDVRLPFGNDNNGLYFCTGLKIKYLYGLFYDKGIRDLSNYYQHFVTGNFSIGLGYSF